MPAEAEELTFGPLPATVERVLRTLVDAGHEVVLVGGCVRDRLRSPASPIANWDAATEAKPEAVAGLFPDASWENRFGTVTVRGVPKVEITSYRAETGYRDRRRPDDVRFGVSLHEDLARRDFTINAIAWAPMDLETGRGRLIDPVGGRADLAANLLRTVGEPRERFAEDALRLIRAARFAGRFGMTIGPGTEAAIRDLATTAAAVSAERIRDEIERMLDDRRPSRALRALERLGLLAVVLPEVAALRGIPQSKAIPGDALDHSLAAVDAAPAGWRSVRWAALLHDVGKATTLANGHFIGHERVGADKADAILRRLRVPAAEAAGIVQAIRHHMYAYDRSWTDAAVRRFIRRVTPRGTDLLFALRRADNAASGVGPAGAANQAELEARISAQLEGQSELLIRNRLAIDGHDLQRELGLAPGRVIGRTLEQLMELVLDDPLLNERSILLARARDLVHER